MLQHIFEQSLRTGEVPKDWTDANISPIFKKDDRNLAVNYWPISLALVSCKMLDHFDRYKVLAKKKKRIQSRSILRIPVTLHHIRPLACI